jgi:ABC-type polar amino acid transport system ATPase subunit
MNRDPVARADMAGPAILMADVSKWYGDYHALRKVNLRVNHGERIVLCGP